MKPSQARQCYLGTYIHKHKQMLHLHKKCFCYVIFFLTCFYIQVVVGSFLPGHQQEQKAKKQRIEPITTISPPPIINSVSGDESRGLYGGIKPIVTPAAFSVDNNSSPLNPMQGFRNSVPENINNKSASLPEEETKGLSQSNCEVSC